MKKILLLICFHFTFSESYAQRPGSLDMSFNPNDKGYGNGVDGLVVFSATQNDGKVLIGGQFIHYKGQRANGLVRLFEDGSIDPSFKIDTQLYIDPVYIYYIQILSNNKILIGGSYKMYHGITSSSFTRLNYDGSIDTTFNPPNLGNWVNSISVQQDGKILVTHANSKFVTRLLDNGQIDTSFNIGLGPNGNVEFIKFQSDQKIIANGNFTNFNGTSCNGIVRLYPNGQIDTSFKFTYINGYHYSITIQQDDKIIISGTFDTVGAQYRRGIARLNSNGSLDLNYNPGQYFQDPLFVKFIALQTDGKLLTVGNLSFQSGEKALSRFNEDGSLDLMFSNNIPLYKNENCFYIGITSANKILIGGDFSFYNNKRCGNFTRLNSDGNIDYTFNKETGVGGELSSILKTDNNRFIIAGKFGSYNGNDSIQNIARINEDGSIDNNFSANVDGKINKAILLPNNKIIIAGEFKSVSNQPRAGIARLNSDGSLDNNFNTNGTGTNNAVISFVKSKNDQYYLIGSFTEYNETYANRIIRLNADGTLDNSFIIKQNSPFLRNIAIDSNNNIYISGITNYDGKSCKGIIKINEKAELDTIFNKNQNISFSAGGIRSLKIFNTNELLVTGSKNSNFQGLCKINFDGTPNGTFNNNIKIEPVSNINDAFEVSNNKLLISGYFTKFNNLNRTNLVIIDGNGIIDTTFNAGYANNLSLRSLIEDGNNNFIIGGGFTTYDNVGRNGIAKIYGLNKTSFVKSSNLIPQLIYPNPTNNEILIHNDDFNSFEIFDNKGRIIEKNIHQNGGAISVNHLSSGIYLLKLYKSDGSSRITRFIKQ